MVIQTSKTGPSTTLNPPHFPKQGEWRYEDWLKFPQDGWKYEIIKGVLHMTPLPAINHQLSSGELFRRIANHVKDNDLGKVVTAPCGVRLPGHPVPLEPDIFFIKKERLDIIGKQYVEGVPDFIIEILSPSNANYDRETKFNLYQQVGVPEYWLVNYEAKTVECFNLVEDSYISSGSYSGNDIATSVQISGFEVKIDLLFDF